MVALLSEQHFSAVAGGEAGFNISHLVCGKEEA